MKKDDEKKENGSTYLWATRAQFLCFRLIHYERTTITCMFLALHTQNHHLLYYCSLAVYLAIHSVRIESTVCAHEKKAHSSLLKSSSRTFLLLSNKAFVADLLSRKCVSHVPTERPKVLYPIFRTGILPKKTRQFPPFLPHPAAVIIRSREYTNCGGKSW